MHDLPLGDRRHGRHCAPVSPLRSTCSSGCSSPLAAADAAAARRRAARTAVTVTVTPASGPALSGTLLEEDDFHVALRDAGGAVRVVRKAPGMKVETVDPLRAHRELLDRITDKNIHDLVAYLETLK